MNSQEFLVLIPESNEPEVDYMTLLQQRILKTITSSQDNEPRAIADIIENSDATGQHITDNLNQMLADVVVRAAKQVEIKEAIADLEYAAHQLYEAAQFMKDEFITKGDVL